MPYIGNTPTQESISDRMSYTGSGTRTVYGIRYTSNMVDVFQNGIKLRENTDYTVNDSGNYITFVIAPESGDIIDLIGYNEITDLARSSYVRENFTATSGQTQFNLDSNISGSDKLNVYLNGLRLSDADFTIDYINKRIVFAAGRTVDDVVSVEILFPGFRSDMHFTRGDKVHHLGWTNPNTLYADVTIDADENAMMVGPLTVESIITVNGTLTIV